MLSHASPTHKLPSQELSQQLGKSRAIAELCPNPVPRGQPACPYLWADGDTSGFSVVPHGIIWQIDGLMGSKEDDHGHHRAKKGYTYQQSLKGTSLTDLFQKTVSV